MFFAAIWFCCCKYWRDHMSTTTFALHLDISKIGNNLTPSQRGRQSIIGDTLDLGAPSARSCGRQNRPYTVCKFEIAYNLVQVRTAATEKHRQ